MVVLLLNVALSRKRNKQAASFIHSSYRNHNETELYRMKNLLLLLPALGLMLTFSSCEDDEPVNQPNTQNTIVGDYELTALVGDVAVDINNDSVSSTDLLDETFCFDNRLLSLTASGDFTIEMPDLNYSQSAGISCSDNSYSGTYTVDMNDVLTVTVPVPGGSVSESKAITITPTTISFTVDRNEVSQYFNPDPNSVIGSINSIEVTYTRI
ncbi:MAG: lipocalin family protein [Nonlabens sp.]